MSKKQPKIELFKVGELVRLKSGGRIVVVAAVWNASYMDHVKIQIVYTGNGKIHTPTEWFIQDIFKKVETDD